MDYKEYLLNQSAINLQYIAEKMWPTNTDAKAYLSRKINGTGRPWTASDNDKARQAIHELGLKLIADTPSNEVSGSVTEKVVVKPVKKESPVKKPIEQPAKEPTIWEKMDKLRNEK